MSKFDDIVPGFWSYRPTPDYAWWIVLVEEQRLPIGDVIDGRWQSLRRVGPPPLVVVTHGCADFPRPRLREFMGGGGEWGRRIEP